MDPHQETVKAFNAYLSVAVVLSEDLMELLDSETQTDSWRRNYIRAVSALVEGTTHCLRRLAQVGVKIDPSRITPAEKEALNSGLGLTASERVKHTFCAVHSMFSLGVDPNQPERWEDARTLLEKNDQLVHPRSETDLVIEQEVWPTLESGANWLTELHFGIAKSIRSHYVARS